MVCGFSLDDNGLYKHLQSLGFSEKNMLATGLVGKNDKGYLYDKFKNRFMFPIFDIQKRLIAFGGRTLESKESMKAKGIPKYVNSPENLIYSKGKHLYGLNVAKSHNSGKMKRILVVEGYMDVISPHQAGITNVVASLGTALTEKQGRLLRNYAEEVILSYDSDDAGQKAILRGIDIMQALNVPIRVLQMDGAKDPDEFVLKYGAEKFEKLIDNSISPVEYKVNLIKKDYDLEDTTQKIAFLTKLAEILSKVNNTIERDVYVDKFSRELKVGKEAIIAEIEKRTIRNSGKLKNWQLPRAISSMQNSGKNTNIHQEEKKNNKNEELIIYLLALKDEDIFHKLKLIYTEEEMAAFQNNTFIKKLYNLYESGDIINKELMSVCETEEENSLLSGILLKSNARDDAASRAGEILRALEMDKLQNEKMKIIKSLQEGKTDEEGILVSKLNEINMKLAKK
ncbi:MAG: DNA primase [Clostridia bacterium]|nr:DNA primase [Clostridia bacterium]